MCPRISRWFLLVFCFLYLYLLLGGASLGILSGSSLISPFSSLFTPFLPSSPSSHLVSHCHFVLGLILPLASLGALSQFSPFWGQPGHTVRLVTPLSPLRTIFSSSASLSSLPSVISFPFLKVFAQSGFAQRGNTLWPKVVFSSHVVSLFALVHPRFAAAFLYAAYADGAAYAAGCLRLPTSIVSWHSPLQYIPCSYSRFLVFTPLLSSWGIVNSCDPRQPGHTVRLVLRSSFFSSPLLYFSTPPHGLSSFTFLYLPTSPFLLFGLYVLACPQEHLLSYFDSYTLSLYLNSLDAIFMFHSPYPVFSAFYSHHY